MLWQRWDDMERLTKRDIDGFPMLAQNIDYKTLLERLAAYEDAEEQRLLIKLPPCKIGDTLYYIMDGKIYSGTLYSIFWQNLYEQ